MPGTVSFCILKPSLWQGACEIKQLTGDPEEIKLLLRKAEEYALEHGPPMLVYGYPSTDSIDKILDELQWNPPVLWKKRYHFESARFRPPWMQKEIDLPENLAILLWQDLPETTIRNFALYCKESGISDHVSPFYREQYRQNINSLVLLEDRQIVGWSATHTFPDSPDTIHYSSLYLHPRLRFRGYGIRLLAESIRKHVQAEIKYGIFEVSLQESNRNWLRFIEKYLEPYAQKIETIIRRFKTLR